MSAERVRWLREQASRLRRMADDLNDQANVVEGELSDRPIITGKDLADAAVIVLLFHGGEGMHYRDLLARVEDETGRRVRGVDPSATFLATIYRDPRIVSCGSRTGRYTVAPD